MPSSTTKANRTNSRLLARKAPSAADHRVDAAGRTQPVAAPDDEADADGQDQAEEAEEQRADADVEKACTDSSTPDRVRNVPRMVRLKVAITSDRFQTRSRPGAAGPSPSGGTRCRSATAATTRSPPGPTPRSRPSRAPGSSTTRPRTMPTVRNAQANRVHAPGLPQPALADPAGHQRGRRRRRTAR